MNTEILVLSLTIEQRILSSCRPIIAAFFPGKSIRVSTCKPSEDTLFMICIEKNTAEFPAFMFSLINNDNEVFQTIYSEKMREFAEIPLPSKEPLRQILVKRALVVFLTAVTAEKMPWGILTGIRPGKLLSRMGDQGLDKQTRSHILTNLYLLEKEKVNLLETIADVQEPYLRKMKHRPNAISLFLMIPFCPSRCFYCSFPSNLRTVRNTERIQAYLNTLRHEVRLTGDMMKEMGLTADCIYIGGGTPTSLAHKEMEALFGDIQKYIPKDYALEYTVEAGRPDSIDKSKLFLMKDFGVNRISINPQSMQEETLIKIGRKHTVSDILTCFRMAREMGDWHINMDLILGLPGEEYPEMINSLETVLALEPDNLTVHALALKRGSQAWEASNETHRQKRNWIFIQKEIQQRIMAAQFKPYYLYRQKNIAGNLENIGYSIPGKICRYNIGIIEEKQMIIGLGAGASSKIHKSTEGHLNLYHPIDLRRYMECYAEKHRQKVEILQGIIENIR